MQTKDVGWFGLEAFGAERAPFEVLASRSLARCASNASPLKGRKPLLGHCSLLHVPGKVSRRKILCIVVSS